MLKFRVMIEFLSLVIDYLYNRNYEELEKLLEQVNEKLKEK